MDNILYSSQKKYLEKFLRNDDPLISDMEIFAKKNKVPILRLLVYHSQRLPKRRMRLTLIPKQSKIQVHFALSRQAALKQIVSLKRNNMWKVRFF